MVTWKEEEEPGEPTAGADGGDWPPIIERDWVEDRLFAAAEAEAAEAEPLGAMGPNTGETTRRGFNARTPTGLPWTAGTAPAVEAVDSAPAPLWLDSRKLLAALRGKSDEWP